jgi:hypothetical protein
MKQFLIVLGMIVAVNAWSKDLYVCDVTRFFGGGAEVMTGVEYKELHTFILKKGYPGEVKVLTVVAHKKRLLLSDQTKITISANAQKITLIDENQDIYGKLDFYEDNKYFGKIVIHADFTYGVQCIKQPVRKGSVY